MLCFDIKSKLEVGEETKSNHVNTLKVLSVKLKTKLIFLNKENNQNQDCVGNICVQKYTKHFLNICQHLQLSRNKRFALLEYSV